VERVYLERGGFLSYVKQISVDEIVESGRRKSEDGESALSAYLFSLPPFSPLSFSLSLSLSLTITGTLREFRALDGSSER